MGNLTAFTNKKREGTARSYRIGIMAFLRMVYGVKPRITDKGRVAVYTPEEYAEIDALSDRYWQEHRDHAGNMIRFVLSLDGKPPKTVRLRIAAVKEWMVANDVEFSQKQLREMKSAMGKGSRAITEDQEMTRENLSTVIAHLPLKARALALVLVSSGMRVGEALRLKDADVRFDTDPVEVRIRFFVMRKRTKTGEARTAFISKEAADLLKEWMRQRPAYLQAKTSKKFTSEPEPDAVFPFQYNTLSEAWEAAIRKAGLYATDPETRRKTYHIHQLRAYFIDNLSRAGGNGRMIAELLAGHTGYLQGAYVKIPRSEQRKYYHDAEQYVSVFSTVYRDPEVDRKIEQLTTDNEKMRIELAAMHHTIQVLAGAIPKFGTA